MSSFFVYCAFQDKVVIDLVCQVIQFFSEPEQLFSLSQTKFLAIGVTILSTEFTQMQDMTHTHTYIDAITNIEIIF